MNEYRTDIDGLRSLAIVPVLLFHAGFSSFPGGFVGVDVFFVISGYLITASLLSDLEAGRYSLLAFYERRVRRIIPALLFVLGIVAVVGWQLLLPADFESLGQSLWATCLFVSNIAFWQSSGDYFGIHAESQPLLHTWSLSVEEQFYILFPLFLWALTRPRNAQLVRVAMLLAMVLSLILATIVVDRSPVAAFYLLPSRAWELLAGSALATGALGAPRSRSTAEVAGISGIVLIIVPVFIYNRELPFPGLGAIPPVLGSALVIYAGLRASANEASFRTVAAKVLSMPVLRFIGLISYSLYLWHWPVIVFWKYYKIELNLADQLAIVAISIILAILSWRYVERPFRKSGTVLPRKPLLAATAGVLAAGTMAGVVVARDGVPSRVPKGIIALAEKRTYQGPGRECGKVYKRNASIGELCVRGARSRKPDFVLLGDSHANALATSVFEAAREVGRSGYQISDTGWRPVIGFAKIGEQGKYLKLNAVTTELLDSHPEIRTIVLSAYWHQAVAQDRYVDGNGQTYTGHEAMRKGLQALLRKYPDKRVLLILPSAHSLSFGANAVARARWFGYADFAPKVSRAVFADEQAAYLPAVAALARMPRVRVIHLSRYLCDGSVCYGLLPDGSPAYTDDNHLSYKATQMLRPEIAAFLAETSTEPDVPAPAVVRR
jgi:peptidoglycan/LPS O-acetylase OafA/YrhL